MPDSIYRKARRKAAKSNTIYRNADGAGRVLLIDRTRLLAIETERILPRPDEIFAMAEKYKAPEICSYYCSKVCQVGKYMNYPDIGEVDFSKISTSLIASMHLFGKNTDTICRIFKDNEITANEIEEFRTVLKMLDELSDYSERLRLWAKKRDIIK